MTAAGVVCQTMSHTGHGWCVSLLTLLAMGVQGQEVIEPRTPYLVTSEDTAEVRKGDGLEIPQSPARESLQGTMKNKQARITTPAEDLWCEKTKHCTERAEQSLLFAKRAERNLLFLTAAGVVCQIRDREWYACVSSYWQQWPPEIFGSRQKKRMGFHKQGRRGQPTRSIT